MRFNGLKSHLRLQKLRFLDAPGLFLLEIVLTGAYDLADVLANVLVLKWMIGALMGRDLIRAAWVLGGFLVYQLSVSFLWHWYFERVYPQWKERLEYKLNRRLYRIMLDADCRKYNDEGYFHGYRRALQFTQTKMEETLEFYRQFSGWCGSGRHLYPHGSDDRCFRFAGVCGKPFLCQKSGGKNERKAG